jgi:hypothetical protein
MLGIASQLFKSPSQRDLFFSAHTKTVSSMLTGHPIGKLSRCSAARYCNGLLGKRKRSDSEGGKLYWRGHLWGGEAVGVWGKNKVGEGLGGTSPTGGEKIARKNDTRWFCSNFWTVKRDAGAENAV